MNNDKKIRCCNCGKVIAEDVSIQAGKLSIRCRCGTMNKFEIERIDTMIVGIDVMESDMKIQREKREYLHSPSKKKETGIDGEGGVLARKDLMSF